MEKLSLYTQKPLEPKNRFALIKCGVNTGYIAFRINHNTFNENDNARKVSWYFKQGTERRMNIILEDIPQILQCLEHAYHATLERSQKNHNAAKKAWETRNKLQ